MTTILGPDGRPLDVRGVMRTLEEPQTAQLGAIRTEWDQHPARGLTPARLASLMTRAEAGDLVSQAELAEDMEERDGHLFAELSKRRGAVTQLAWDIAPPDKATPAEEALTELVRDWVSLITARADELAGGMDVLLQLMIDAVHAGYSPIELAWPLRTDSRGRQVRVPDAVLQPRRWFTLSGDRRRFLLRSHSQMTPAGPDGIPPVQGVELRPLAWLMHVHPARLGYPGRQSLARVTAWPYLFKNFATRDLAEFLEIYGLPLRVGRYPAGAGDNEKRALLQAVAQIGHNAAGIIPAGMAIDFQAAAAGTEVPFDSMIDRMDAVHSKVVLGQTLSASEGQHGTQALGDVHNEVRHDIRDADARLVERSFTERIIKPLVMLNAPGADALRCPRLLLDTGDAEDLAAFADHLPKLAKAGLKIPVKWVHEKLRIPEAEDGEAVLEAAEPPPMPGMPGAPGQPGDPKAAPGQKPPGARGKAANDAKAEKDAKDAQDKKAALTGEVDAVDPPRDQIDDLVAEQAAQWVPLLGPMVEPLLAEIDKALAAGETLDAFAARLPELITKMDAQPMTTAVARAAFAARLAGEAGINLSEEDQTP